jgi:predicted RNase H-like HicB family nuclease
VEPAPLTVRLSQIIIRRYLREEGFMEHRFTAVFERDGDWWIAYVEELPGANTQGRTLEEARENLKEAIALVLQANRESNRMLKHPA